MNIIDLSSFKGARPPQPSESSRAKGRSYGRDRQVPEDPGETQTEDLGFRDRACVKREIEAHIEARRTYQAAVSWLAAAEAENLSTASIEVAREDTGKFYAEMVEAARSLVIGTLLRVAARVARRAKDETQAIPPWAHLRSHRPPLRPPANS